MEKESVLFVKNLSIQYTDNVVIKEINFDLKKGETLSIVGKSGTGKSSLLNAIAGFIPYKGEVAVKGKIGFCFQNNSLFPFMTIAQNLAFGLADLSQLQKKERIAYLLDMLEMAGYGDKYPSHLSGGQVQRIALGRAISYFPEILLLDESFSALDLFTRDAMIEWVNIIIQKLNISLILVTHYLDESILLSDKIIVLKNQKAQILTSPIDRKKRIISRYTAHFQEFKQHIQLQL